ncbi:MAG TPA: acyl-CoA dehydrogenase family protein [Acidimicrobiales bacterium]
MNFAYTASQVELRRELASYFATINTPEVIEEVAAGETGGPACLDAVRQMGQDGYLTLSWPTEYGGGGLSGVDQLIFFDEAWRSGAPIPFLTINTVGQTLMEYGTPEQKEYFLPKISAGELHFSIGYTEPTAGTDLASLKTSAVKDGDEWIINGQKVFTSLASYADWVWLAARTDPDAPKHAGITMFLVPTTDPGFSWTKTHTMVNASTFTTYYSDVRVTDWNVVHGVNRGWELITNQLNYERVSLAPPGMIAGVFEDTVEWAKATTLPDGRKVIEQEWARLNLARVKAKLEYLRLINLKVASSGHKLNAADASATKVFGTEFFCEAYRLMGEVVGQSVYLQRGSPGAHLVGRIERGYQGTLILTFGGGVNEVQRDLICLFGLGMPRVPRH